MVYNKVNKNIFCIDSVVSRIFALLHTILVCQSTVAPQASSKLGVQGAFPLGFLKMLHLGAFWVCLLLMSATSKHRLYLSRFSFSGTKGTIFMPSSVLKNLSGNLNFSRYLSRSSSGIERNFSLSTGA